MLNFHWIFLPKKSKNRTCKKFFKLTYRQFHKISTVICLLNQYKYQAVIIIFAAKFLFFFWFNPTSLTDWIRKRKETNFCYILFSPFTLNFIKSYDIKYPFWKPISSVMLMCYWVHSALRVSSTILILALSEHFMRFSKKHLDKYCELKSIRTKNSVYSIFHMHM